MLNLTIILNLVILILVLVATWVILGVIWRTRNGLDVCHKCLLAAIIILGIGAVLRILDALYLISAGIIPRVLDILFVVFFIAGLWKMRNIIRKIDGEIK